MKDLEIQSKLTPAARQTLDELVEDYRNQILVKANENAQELGTDVRELSVHDVLRGVSRIYKRNDRELPFLDRLLSLYSIMGWTLGISGLLFFSYQQLNLNSLSFEKRLPLLLAVAGIAVAVVSSLFARLRYRTIQSRGAAGTAPSEFVSSFLSRWSQIESGLRKVAASTLGESSANAPLLLIADKLVEASVLKTEDRSRFRELLRMRNSIVHEGISVNEEKMKTALRDSDRLLARIESTTLRLGP